jgi:hypothetical protein
MPNKGKKLKNVGVKLLPDSSWSKETMIFKVEKKKYRRTIKDRVPCEGVLCRDKKENKSYVFKGEECDACYSHAFKDLRFSQSQTPYYDPQFLTRLNVN